MIKSLILIAVTVFTSIDYCFANKLFVLYGYKIGQSINNPKLEYGKPSKEIKHDDGFISYVYDFEKHYVIFQCDNTRPDLIWGIQLTGEKNSTNFGLNGLNLGDPSKKVIKILGKPDKITTAVDDFTKKELKDITYYSYHEKGNYSIEIENDKVSSIKINFIGPMETNNLVDFSEFVKSVKSKNYYKIATFISTNFTIYKVNKSYNITKSIFNSLMNDKIFNDTFFNKSYGISSITNKNDITSAMRLEDKSAGFVYKINKNNVKYELFFIKSFDGWVLKYIDFI